MWRTPHRGGPSCGVGRVGAVIQQQGHAAGAAGNRLGASSAAALHRLVQAVCGALLPINTHAQHEKLPSRLLTVLPTSSSSQNTTSVENDPVLFGLKLRMAWISCQICSHGYGCKCLLFHRLYDFPNAITGFAPITVHVLRAAQCDADQVNRSRNADPKSPGGQYRRYSDPARISRVPARDPWQPDAKWPLLLVSID